MVGLNAFSHESGIHIAAVLEEAETYELFSPDLVGNKRRIVIGKHTGKKALQYKSSLSWATDRPGMSSVRSSTT